MPSKEKITKIVEVKEPSVGSLIAILSQAKDLPWGLRGNRGTKARETRVEEHVRPLLPRGLYKLFKVVERTREGGENTIAYLTCGILPIDFHGASSRASVPSNLMRCECLEGFKGEERYWNIDLIIFPEVEERTDLAKNLIVRALRSMTTTYEASVQVRANGFWAPILQHLGFESVIDPRPRKRVKT